MKACRTCEYAIFDEVWGEYKCKKKERRIYETTSLQECEFYKKVKEKKDDRQREN